MHNLKQKLYHDECHCECIKLDHWSSFVICGILVRIIVRVIGRVKLLYFEILESLLGKFGLAYEAEILKSNVT